MSLFIYNRCMKKHVYGRSKDLLSLSLYRLLLIKNYDDIGVNDICKMANVSRMSFYRFYSSKDDILVDFCDEKFELLVDEISSNQNINFKDFLYILFQHFSKYSRQLLVLKKAHRLEILSEQLNSYGLYIATHFKNFKIPRTEEGKYLISFISGGIFNVLVSWLDADLKTPIESVTNKILQLFNQLNFD